MVQYFPVITGSLTVNGNLSVSGNVAVTGSMSGTSSLAANAELLSGTGSVGFTTTGSFTVASSSLSSRTTQIESVYATTGSNSFRATQSITGSLTVTGQIVAQTLNVQQVTSSIVYSSGSNVFGCDLNSRQTFTGSVLMTGSLIVNTTGPELQVNNNGVILGNLLTDNHSITGSLRVTGSSATFSGEVSIPNGLFSINGNAISGPPTGGVGIRHVNNRLLIYGGTTDITFQKNSNAGPNLIILESGASTFCAATGGAITLTTNGSANNWTSAVVGNSTTSQSFGLLIQAGTNSTDGALRVRNQANNLDWLFVRGDGNVGIGTISPSSTFHIRGTFGAPLTTGTCLNGVARFGQTSGNGGLDIGFGDPYSWLQSRNATDYSVNYNLSLQPNGGNVGIGTITPTALLHVLGPNATGTFFTAQNDGAGGAIFSRINASTYPFNQYLFNNGNVGIGNSGPRQRLDTTGAIRASCGSVNGDAIATAYGRTFYKVIISSNYDAGNNVRAAEWNLLTNNEGTGITIACQVYSYNGQSATFSVSGGSIIVNSLSSGNNQIGVYTN